MDHLCCKIVLLDRVFHGQRGDNVRPDWPPDPLRLFLALVAACEREPDAGRRERFRGALRWLESLGLPAVVAPEATAGQIVHFYVPNNSGDRALRAWAGRHKGAPASLAEVARGVDRTSRYRRTLWLRSDDPVCFLWPLPAGSGDQVAVVGELMSRLACFGWGIDQATGSACVLDETGVRRLRGARWEPDRGSASRAPVVGTLDAALERWHRQAGMVQGNTVEALPPLGRFRRFAWRSSCAPRGKPWAAFSLRRLGLVDEFQSYDPIDRTPAVAAMVRAGVAGAALEAGRDPEWVTSFLRGHAPDGSPLGQAPRFAWVPLPSIEPDGPSSGHGWMHERRFRVGRIRRVLLVEEHVAGDVAGTESTWARRMLGGLSLPPPLDDSVPGAVLDPLDDSDGVVMRYVGTAAEWTTVTPVLLPGRGRRSPTGTTRLLRVAIRHSGFSHDLAEHADIEWSHLPMLAGCLRACEYREPAVQAGRYHALHVRIRWRGPDGQALELPGPLCLGAGRFAGFGLFVGV